MLEQEQTLSIAIQKDGRLGPPSVQLLKEGDFKFNQSSRVDRALVADFPLKVLFVRNSDIPNMVEAGDVQLGITGQVNLAEELVEVVRLMPLGFAYCDVVVGTGKDSGIQRVEQLAGLTIATSFPNITGRFFADRGIPIKQKVRDGSIELAIAEGWAEGIVDVSTSGESMQMNGITSIDTVIKGAQAELIASPTLRDIRGSERVVEPFLREILAVLRSRENLLFKMNVLRTDLDSIVRVLPSQGSPTLADEANSRFIAVESVVPKRRAREVRELLLSTGARDLLELEARKVVPNKDDRDIMEMMERIYC